MRSEFSQCEHYSNCKSVIEAMASLKQSDLSQNINLMQMNENITGVHKDILTHMKWEEESVKARDTMDEAIKEQKALDDLHYEKDRDLRFKVYGSLLAIGIGIFSYSFTSFMNTAESRAEAIESNSKAIAQINEYNVHNQKHIEDIVESLKDINRYIRDKK